MPKKNGVARYQKFSVGLPTGDLTLYASPKVLNALQEVTTGMNLYKGVRLAQVMKTVYQQGLKDGRKEVISGLERLISNTNHLSPGRPRKVKLIK